MRRLFSSLLIGFVWLFASMCLMYMKDGSSGVFWQTSHLFWPGSIIAIQIAVIRSTGQFFGEGWNDILVVLTASFWIAALSNLIFFSGLAYILLSLLPNAKRNL